MKKSFLLFLLVIFCFTWWLPHTDADTQEIKDLMSAYATADHQGRLDIIHKLGKFGPEADSWLVEILYVEGSRHLLNTATVLVENRIKNKRELLDKIILRTLTDPDSVYRNAGARALAYFEVNRDYIDTRLINAALTDVNGDIRQNAAVAIGNSPPTARKAVALFRRHLKNDRLMIGYPAQHRVNAIDAMGYMGEYAKDAALDLLHPAILEDPIINSAPMIIETFMRLSSNGKKALPKLIELYDKNNSSLSKEDILNIFSEMFNPQSPLSPRIKEIIPTIIKEFDDPNSYHLPEVLNLLSQFKSDPAVIDVLPKIANKTLHEDDPLIRSKAIILFDDIMSSLSSKEINKLNPEIKKQMYLFKHQTNECKILCSLVDNVDKWSHESYETPDHNFVPDSWGFAIESLGALYMSKVSPFCKAADEMVDQVILEQVEGSEKAQVCRPKKFPFKSLTKLYRDTFDIYLSPQTSPDVYGKQFFTLFMRDVLRKKQLSPSTKNLFENRQKIAETFLEEDISRAKKLATGPSKHSGSLFNQYALAVNLLTLGEKDTHTKLLSKDEKKQHVGTARKLIQKGIDPNNPLKMGYDPFRKPQSERASAARNVPVHLALYQTARNPEKRKEHRAHLTKSLKNYRKHLPSLLGFLRRVLMKDKVQHIGDDDLAAYYFYGTLPYVTAAIKLLEEENRPEEKQMIDDMKKEFKAVILSLYREDGLFYTPELDASPSYVNPLLGLALIPLADACVGDNKDPSILHGIMD